MTRKFAIPYNCHFGTQEQKLEVGQQTACPHWMKGIWNFVIFEPRNKSSRVCQQPPPTHPQPVMLNLQYTDQPKLIIVWSP